MPSLDCHPIEALNVLHNLVGFILIITNKVVREVNARVLGRGLKLVDGNDNEWELNQLQFTYDTVVVADSERKLCQLVTEFGMVCERRKLRVNVDKSKVMRCTRNEVGARLNAVLNGEAL